MAKPKPLENKDEIMCTQGSNHYFIGFSKEKIVSAVAFYKMYRYRPDLLLTNQNKIWKLFVSDNPDLIESCKKSKMSTIYTSMLACAMWQHDPYNYYMKWLFDYAFADVVGKVGRKR